VFDWIATPEGWIALATLFALEVVLGIDNIVFLSILVGRLPTQRREIARKLGLCLALVARLALLFSITWVMGLVDPLFSVLGEEISWRDIILIGGGLFLLAKSTHEIHNSLEGVEDSSVHLVPASFGMALVQIALLDIVFSLDSVITAVGMVGDISLMAIAIVMAVIVMLFAAKPIGDFVDERPTVKILALSFLILVGVTLIAEGLDFHVPKGYVYFAMAFSIAVEMINIKMRKRAEKPVRLNKQMRAKVAQEE
jgi:predicted tellurium resistance membrane protein TerC